MSGFVLPKTAAFTGFTSTGVTSNNTNQINASGNFDIGWNFNTNTGRTIFFAAKGCRDTYNSGTGSLASSEREGNYWTVGAQSTSQGRYLVFTASYVNPQSLFYRGMGFFCYPVLDM